MLDDKSNDPAPADKQPAKLQRNPWPPLPEPFNVRHVTMSGGLFGGREVIRTEYIDRSRPRRSWLPKLFRRADTPTAR